MIGGGASLDNARADVLVTWSGCERSDMRLAAACAVCAEATRDWIAGVRRATAGDARAREERAGSGGVCAAIASNRSTACGMTVVAHALSTLPSARAPSVARSRSLSASYEVR